MTTDRLATRGPRRATSWRRRAAAAVLAAATAASLAGCTTDRLGTAAIVEGEAISTAEVQDLSREYDAVVPGQPPGRVQLSVLQQLVVDRVFAAMARDLDVHVRAGRVSRELDALVEQVGGRKALVRALATQQRQVVPPSQLESWMRDRLLFDAIARRIAGTAEATEASFEQANRELTKYAASMDIEVNPRYGTWNPDSGIAPLVSGGLSRTVEELAKDGS